MRKIEMKVLKEFIRLKVEEILTGIKFGMILIVIVPIFWGLVMGLIWLVGVMTGLMMEEAAILFWLEGVIVGAFICFMRWIRGNWELAKVNIKYEGIINCKN